MGARLLQRRGTRGSGAGRARGSDAGWAGGASLGEGGAGLGFRADRVPYWRTGGVWEGEKRVAGCGLGHAGFPKNGEKCKRF